jgi:hypothetical protein
MSEDTETKKDDFILTDELREKASQTPVFNILYVTDDDSKLSPFRGESIIKRLAMFYEKQANINYSISSSAKLANIKLSELDQYNIVFIDNVNNFRAAKHLADIQQEILISIDPKWRETLQTLTDTNKEEAINFVNALNKKKEDKLRIIYALDEFVWEAPIGRSHDIQTVQLIETYMNMADIIIVPTGELKEAIRHFNFVGDKNKAIMVIPTSVDYDFFPLYKDFTRSNAFASKQLRDKPKVLIKGISVPENIQQFILDNHKKMDITLCSVGEVNEHIQGLLARKKVGHIYHWANPYVNRKNIGPTYAIERDGGYDFVIHTKPDNLNGEMYEITSGDEDILFSIAYGAIPVSGIDHLGYDEDSSHLSKICGLSFGKETTAKSLRSMIEAHTVPVKWNEVFNKCRSYVENRISNSPLILARYFSAFLGKELARARAEIASEIQSKMEVEVESENKSTENKPEVESNKPQDNVIVADFGKGSENE